MSVKFVVIDYNLCQPLQCDGGRCFAVYSCPHKLLNQEAPYDVPMPDPAICRGCAKCVTACPLKAVKVIAA